MLKISPLFFCAAMIGCASSGSSVSIAKVPDSAAVSVVGSAGSYLVSLGIGQTAQIQEEALTVQLVEVNDSRCPPDVRCVWAGQATATLLVFQSGSPAQSLKIGTSAPANFPSQASYGSFQFSLKSLEPGPSKQGPAAAELVRATVLIEKLR
jgi:hypothetical protein